MAKWRTGFSIIRNAGFSSCPCPATPRPDGEGAPETAPDAAPTRFLVKAARLLRDRGHDVSPAGTVEAVRLAEGLAALRGRPGPGLGEVLDAAEAALAGGSSVPLRLITSDVSCAPRCPPVTCAADGQRYAHAKQPPHRADLRWYEGVQRAWR